jgi:2-isopropylmalate synthase
MTDQIAQICADVARISKGFWESTHNDCELSANALAAVEQGFQHVQGCFNGYGERCGNANLTTIIANLELKLGHSTIGKERLTHLTAGALHC